MALTAKFVSTLQVVETQETRDRIFAIAERDEISMAQVIREIIALGIEQREAAS